MKENKYSIKESNMKTNFLNFMKKKNKEANNWKKLHPEINSQFLLIILKTISKFTKIQIHRQCYRNKENLKAFLEHYWEIFSKYLNNIYLLEITDFEFNLEKKNFLNIKNKLDKSCLENSKFLAKEAAFELANLVTDDIFICTHVVFCQDDNSELLLIPILKKKLYNSQRIYYSLPTNLINEWSLAFSQNKKLNNNKTKFPTLFELLN